jgi:hypothetical protein
VPSTNGHGSSPERVAPYLRVSSEERRDCETIEAQRAEVENHCRLHGLEALGVGLRRVKELVYPPRQRGGSSSRCSPVSLSSSVGR